MTSPFVRRAVSAAALLLAAPMALQGQAATGTIRGKVTEASSGRGLPDAQISVVGTRLGVLSQATGEYTISGVPVGARVVQVRRIGFQPVSRTVQVLAGSTLTVDAALSVSAINLSEVVVTGTASPTEKRRVGTSIATVDSTVVSKAQAVTVLRPGIGGTGSE
jgi:TonB-dependent starch-binding outer membrane protein SusC